MSDDEKRHFVDSNEKATNSGKSSNDDIRSMYKSLLKNITVEPILFPYLIATILVILANQNLNIQKACRVNLNLSYEVCKELENKDNSSLGLTDSEIMVQKLVADMLFWQSILQNSIIAVLVIFLGSWSDRNRLRLPCMLLPIYGEIVRNVGLLVCVYFFDELPMEVSGLWQILPIAVTGYWSVMFMAVFSYIGDVSTEKSKSMRVGTANLTMALCLPIGTGMSGILYRELGFTGIYTIALVFCFISIWMAHVFIHDTRRIKCKSSNDHTRSKWTRVKFFFNLKHIVSAYHVTFKNDTNNRRMKVIVLTILIATIMGPILGEKGVAYLFTRIKFNWNEVQYSVFSTTCMCINLIGTLFVVGFLVKKYGVDDALIGTVATTGKFISQFIFAFAPSQIIFYSGAIVNCLQGPAIISMKTIINKIIPSEELGQVTAVTSLGENIIPIICGPLYSYVYESTVDYFPGAYYLVTAVITTPTIFLYLWLYIQHKNETRGLYENLDRIGIIVDNGLDPTSKSSYGSIKAKN